MTYIPSTEFGILDVKPARSHDLVVKNEGFECRLVRPKDMTESS